MSFEQYKKPAGAGAVQNNYAGDGAPTVNNDTSEGYSVGSRWVDITNDESYICMDATEGSAVWVLSTAGTAVEVVFTPAGGLASTNVQDALEELDTEKQPILSEGAFVNGDKTKLDNIEAGADVTDATNVDSAGATMNSDTNVSGNSWVLDEDNMASDSNTKVPTQQSVKAYIASQLATVGGSPAGTITAFAGSSAPTDWLLCDGSAVSRTTYATLFALISTTYGVGDGSTTFNLPNLKGKIPVGRDAGQTEFDTLGETGGAKEITLTGAQSGLPAHSHGFKNRSGLANSATGYIASREGNGSGFMRHGTTDQTDTDMIASNTASDASQAHSNLQPYLVINYIIKT